MTPAKHQDGAKPLYRLDYFLEDDAGQYNGDGSECGGDDNDNLFA